MQLEVRKFISENLLTSKLQNEFPELGRLLDKSEIKEAPSFIEADYSLNLAFLLTRARKASSQVSSVEAAAKDVVAALSRDRQEYFSFSASENGYVNIRISNFAKLEFLEKFANGLIQVENHPKFQVNKNLLFRLASETDNNELISFVESISVGDSANDFLMALAAVSNKELDLRPYKNGLSGKQNLPWYLARFRADALSFLTKLKRTTKDSLADTYWTNTRDILGDSSQGLGATSAALGLVMGFRDAWSRSFSQDRPSILCSYLMACLDAFYFYYNRPEVRSLSLGQAPLLQLRQLTKSLLFIVDKSDSTFEFVEVNSLFNNT